MATPQPIALTGQWTASALQTTFPAASYPFCMAWVTDRLPAAGYMYSNGSAWVADTTVPGSITPLGDTAGGSAGVSANYSREDHAHPIFVLPVSAPNARTLSLATAYQATNTAKPAVVTINLSSSAAISLSGGTTNTADVVIGPTNGVAGGTGTAIGKYANSNTGTLTIGLNISTVAANPTTFVLPAGWFFAVRQTAGTVTITSAYDQAIG
mgnify:CR=1 FL=1